ncbi:MAG: hypothetical protein HKN27_08300, partial [Silicimonas sp.]|nr:hypothetical protein [Silicimonas sp.]
MQVDTLIAATDASDHCAFTKHLGSDNDVLRSAAIRALPCLEGEQANANRASFLAALLDPDPDVRSDAMEALAPLARPEDATALLQSLEGDPVREVKLAAISALVRLKDRTAIPLFRALATTRAEDRVTWEDAGSDWEDWLDIQTAAIRALGDLRADTAIEDLLTALNDPYGQTVDEAVFDALTGMGDKGIGTLLDLFHAGSDQLKRRVAKTLANASPESFALHLDALIHSEAPQLRELAATILPGDDARCEALATSDPDPSVRSVALRNAATAVPKLARKGLSDPNEQVKAIAVQHLAPPFDPAFHEALVDNMLVWLDDAQPVLAGEAAARLPVLAPNRAEGPLLKTLDNADRPLEVRVAAARAMGCVDLPVAHLVQRLDNAARQVRAAILTVLRDRAISGETAAIEAAVAAISGDIEVSTSNGTLDASAPDMGTPKEGAGPRKIWITPDGDIVENQDQQPPVRARSTLDAILSDQEQSPKFAEDTPEETGAKRMKRRAVEGSDDIAATLVCDAIRIFSGVDDARLTDAIIARVSHDDPAVRFEAWTALASKTLPEGFRPTAETAFRDAEPVIRAAAFRILSKSRCPDILTKGLADDDT